MTNKETLEKIKADARKLRAKTNVEKTKTTTGYNEGERHPSLPPEYDSMLEFSFAEPVKFLKWIREIKNKEGENV